MKVIYAPDVIDPDAYLNSTVFLAGSIEQDKAEKWQEKVISSLADCDITIFNPRREAWDSSWSNTIEHSESPVTLMELGMQARAIPMPKIIVCCPDGYWRKGNVDIVCRRQNIKQVDSLEALIEAIRQNA